MSKILICLIAGGLIALGACSDDSSTGEPWDTTSGTGGTSALGGAGGAGPIDGGSPGGVGGTYVIPPDVDELLITVEQGTDARGFPFSRAGATFSNSANGEVPHLRQVENCSIVDSRDFKGYSARTPTVGTITISDTRSQGDKRIQDIAMEPLLSRGRLRTPRLYAYETPAVEAPRWVPLDRLVVSAEGAELLGFQVALVFPDKVEVMDATPRSTPLGLPIVRRDQALQLEWAPIDEQVSMIITQYRQDAPDRPAYCVRCSFLGHLGVGRVSPTVLADLDVDDMLTPGFSRTEVFVGGQRVAQATIGMHRTWVTINNGRILMVDVK